MYFLNGSYDMLPCVCLLKSGGISPLARGGDLSLQLAMSYHLVKKDRHLYSIKLCKLSKVSSAIIQLSEQLSSDLIRHTYKMVFVPFTSINHHNRCITFAFDLLSDDIVGAYKLMLEEFKNAFGKDPNFVITHQDPYMNIAILECFPNTRQRLCMWHIMQKLVTKVGTAICIKTDFKRRICDIVWTDQILPFEFEREWEIMIKDFQLDDNKWLQDMFDIRESWIPAFLRDELMAGLMRTTSRSESENHFFGKWTSPHLTLVEFLSHYDTAIEYQRYIERKNDHDSRYKNPKLKTDLQMEKEASTFYTRTVFFDVQDEIYASYSHCMSVNVVQVDNAEKYSIRDMQAENRIRGDNNFVVYQVDFCKSEMEIECSCKHYEAYGLLCRHIFYVLRMNNIKEFPRKYLNKRWLKNAKPFNAAVRRIVGGSYSILESEVFDLYEIFESTIDRLVHDMDKLKIYKEQMKDLLNKAKIDVPTVPKLNSKDVFSAMLGVKEPTSKTIGNPDQSSNKGTGVHSRWKSKAEIEKEAAKNSEKRRTCSKCGNKEGHNSRTCTNERVQPSNKVKKTLQATPTRTGLRSRRN
ncbi:FAR1 DNA binding domain, zinc finger, SWIM-type, MULE transposase domain containing protein [Tanacetum coccineum]